MLPGPLPAQHTILCLISNSSFIPSTSFILLSELASAWQIDAYHHIEYLMSLDRILSPSHFSYSFKRRQLPSLPHPLSLSKLIASLNPAYLIYLNPFIVAFHLEFVSVLFFAPRQLLFICIRILSFACNGNSQQWHNGQVESAEYICLFQFRVRLIS